MGKQTTNQMTIATVSTLPPTILKGVTPGSYYVPYWCSATTHKCAEYALTEALAYFYQTGSIMRPCH